jgi:hypothetical protein
MSVRPRSRWICPGFSGLPDFNGIRKEMSSTGTAACAGFVAVHCDVLPKGVAKTAQARVPLLLKAAPNSHFQRILRLARPCITAAIAVLAICTSPFAQQAAPQKIRILCLAPPLPVMIAESGGVLAKYGSTW